MIELESSVELPRPGPGKLVLYVMGPGFGESQVVAFPDGRWMVVDGCTRAGLNLPLMLLRTLGCPGIDLLVITHPDLDHIRGVPELIEQFSPKRVWMYPAAASLRNNIIRWTRNAPKERRPKLEALRDLQEQIKHILETKNNVREVNAATRAWPDDQRDYRVECLAPTQVDQSDLQKLLDDVFEVAANQVTVADAFQKRLLGLAAPGDMPNQLSLALSVQWERFRFLLAGDVENGASAFSGWPGVLDVLRQDGRLELVTRLDLVKVAHHGSNGAFHAASWDLHGQGCAEHPVALLTPFNKKAKLPDADALSKLRDKSSHLGITADAGKAFERATHEGFQRVSNVVPKGRKVSGPVLAATFRSDGRLILHAGDMAALFKPTPRRTANEQLLAEDPFEERSELIAGPLS